LSNDNPGYKKLKRQATSHAGTYRSNNWFLYLAFMYLALKYEQSFFILASISFSFKKRTRW